MINPLLHLSAAQFRAQVQGTVVECQEQPYAREVRAIGDRLCILSAEVEEKARAEGLPMPTAMDVQEAALMRAEQAQSGLKKKMVKLVVTGTGGSGCSRFGSECG